MDREIIDMGALNILRAQFKKHWLDNIVSIYINLYVRNQSGYTGS